MSIKATYKYLFIVLTALMIGVLSSTLTSVLTLSLVASILIIPSVIMSLIIIVVYKYRYRNNELYEVFLFPLMGTTILLHSILVAGANISISDVYLVIMTLILLVFNTKDVKLPIKFLIIPIIYLIYCLLSMSWAEDRSKSVAPFIQYVEFMILGTLVFFNIKREITLVKMVAGYILFTSTLALIALFITVTQGFISDGPLYVLGFHKNALGSIVGNCIPLSVGLFMYYKDNKKKKILLLGATVLCTLVLLLTASRGSMLGAAAGIIIILFMIRKVRMVFITIPLGALMLWVFSTYISPDFLSSATNFERGTSAYTRIIAYNDVVSKIQQSPWIGYGLGNYLIEIPSMGFSQDDPNNVFMLNLVEIGIIGLVLFSLIILSIFRIALFNRTKFKKDPKLLILSAIFIGGFISQLVHIQVDVSWVRGTGLFMFANVGMLLCLRNTNIERALG